VPIPFHNDEALDALGAAAFLVIRAVSKEPHTYIGGVFLINAIGEPLEFAFNRVELIPSVLWSGVDMHRAATNRLIHTIFEAINLTPKILFILSDSVAHYSLESFEPLKFDIPAVAVTSSTEESTSPASVIWGPIAPDPEESRLYELISSRGLLFEPFLRTQAALREVYREWSTLI
jgi:hypothetical protein